MRSVRFVAPGPRLADSVAFYWLHDADGQSPDAERVLPTGTIELVIDLLHPARAPIVCGTHARYFVMQRAARESYVGVHFRPGHAAAFLGVAAHEVTDANVPLDALWGRRAFVLRDRILEAGSDAARVATLEAALVAAAAAPVRHACVSAALNALVQAPSRHTITSLARDGGVPARRFIQLFREHVGLAPKQFARVQRFQAALRDVEGARANGRPAEWTRTAQRTGYYDQAHLVREFRAFTGLAPGAYLRLRGEDPNHVQHRA